MRRGKRGFDSMNPQENSAQMAGPGASGQYQYGSEMWAMGAPVQRGQGGPGMSGDVPPMAFQVWIFDIFVNFNRIS